MQYYSYVCSRAVWYSTPFIIVTLVDEATTVCYSTPSIIVTLVDEATIVHRGDLVIYCKVYLIAWYIHFIGPKVAIKLLDTISQLYN